MSQHDRESGPLRATQITHPDGSSEFLIYSVENGNEWLQTRSAISLTDFE